LQKKISKQYIQYVPAQMAVYKIIIAFLQMHGRRLQQARIEINRNFFSLFPKNMYLCAPVFLKQCLNKTINLTDYAK
jgi:hypothetical protein